ncbi:MAG TPA: hypothetical protein VGO97_05775 [Solirubrobacterales bacterium]|jgi:hypothetical protein|nr:hypothetical protein [Solirubrobacterales bacterium]
MKTELRSALIAASVAALVAAPFSGAATEQVKIVVKKATGKDGPRGPRGRRGATGVTGPSGTPSADLDRTAWRASSNETLIAPGNSVTLSALCPADLLAIDGGFVAASGGLRVLAYERWSVHPGDLRQGYRLTVANEGLNPGRAQVRAYCAPRP